MYRFYALFSFFLLFTSLGQADSLQEEIDRATRIVVDFTQIPSSVIEEAKGFAILSVLKGGFIFSGQIGSGLVIAKTSKGWSAPSAIGVAGVGYGFQIGAETTEYLMVLNTQEAVRAFARGGSLTIGAELSIAAGPIGQTLQGAVTPFAAMYSYSRSKGLFAGVSLEGAVVVEKKENNARFYQRNVTARELLSGQIPPPKRAAGLYEALDAYAE